MKTGCISPKREIFDYLKYKQNEQGFKAENDTENNKGLSYKRTDNWGE